MRWLSEVTGISIQTIQRRLASPERFELTELAAIATALDIPAGDLTSAWATTEQGAR